MHKILFKLSAILQSTSKLLSRKNLTSILQTVSNLLRRKNCTMDNLTVRELQTICKKLDVSHTGLKAELIDRLVDHISGIALSHSKIVDDELPQISSVLNNSDDSRRITFISKLKRRFIDPLLPSEARVVINDDGSATTIDQINPWFSGWKGPLFLLALAIGVFGGFHSFSQILRFYFGESMHIPLPRMW